VIFGLLAIVLVAASGAVVDFTATEQARSRAQTALDSASLGMQPTIYNTGVTAATIKPRAQSLLLERLAEDGGSWIACASASTRPPCASVDNVAVNTIDGTLRLESTIRVGTAFVGLIGIPTMQAKLVSEATRKRLNIEVAMVLDNSGSMAQSNRMPNLKTAANNAVDILFGANETLPNVFIGVVPFTEFVNVGTASRDKPWMDRNGINEVSRQNFDNDANPDSPVPRPGPSVGPVNRFNLYDAMPNVSWRGCVEARKSPYDTDDTVPTTSAPDTLFTPLFGPDEPDGRGFPNSYLPDSPAMCGLNCQYRETQSYCTSDGSFCLGGTSSTWVYTAPNGTQTTGSSVCSCPSFPDAPSVTMSGGGFLGATRTRTFDCYSARVLQEKMCKYMGNIDTGRDGPNWDCPTTAVLPLSNSKSTVKSRITAMKAEGGTNIHQGAIWGFHMLSPTEPLAEARGYDTATYKVMIVMTDGENTHSSSSNMNGATWYTAYGYPYNGRLTGNNNTELQTAMDDKTKATCTNAKTAGITVFTIGLSSPNDSTRNMLKSCASGDANAYFPTNPSQLDAIFTEIATQLSKLRLAQ
jgi:Mg-chelatase subunit ChlD